MASSLLRAVIAKRDPPPCDTSQDLESFLWVIIYVVYRNGVDEGGALSENNLEDLTREFNALFSAHSAEKLLQKRFFFLLPEGHRHLLKYARTKSSTGRNLSAVLIEAIVHLHSAMQSSNDLSHYYNPSEVVVLQRRGHVPVQFTFNHTMVLVNVLREGWAIETEP